MHAHILAYSGQGGGFLSFEGDVLEDWPVLHSSFASYRILFTSSLKNPKSSLLKSRAVFG